MASTISAGTTSGTAIAISGDTSGALVLQTNGTTTAVTIDTSQNVGIGTSSPSRLLSLIGGNIGFQENGTARTIVWGTTASAAKTSIDGLEGASGYLAVATNSAERMRIDSSGNVGIGTGSPGEFLHLYKASGDLAFRIQTSAGNCYVVNRAATSAMDLLNAMNGPITLATNNTERMRIDSSGNLLVGLTSIISGQTGTNFQVSCSASNNAAHFQNTNATPYGINIQYSAATPNGTANQFLYCYDATTTRAIIRSNGGLANYSANNVNLSDAREKTNIELADSYLDKICSIPVKTFNYIDQNIEEDGGLTLGVIAQDVQAVAPELVTESNWGTEEEPKERLSIYQTDLQYALMKCIQEQQALIIQLQADVAALKGVK